MVPNNEDWKQAHALPKHVIKYSVLRDTSVEEIRSFAETHPQVFIFVFATSTVEECHDYNELSGGEEIFWHVFKPYYIGNFSAEDQEQIIKEFIQRSFFFTDDEVIEVKE